MKNFQSILQLFLSKNTTTFLLIVLANALTTSLGTFRLHITQMAQVMAWIISWMTLLFEAHLMRLPLGIQVSFCREPFPEVLILKRMTSQLSVPLSKTLLLLSKLHLLVLQRKFGHSLGAQCWSRRNAEPASRNHCKLLVLSRGQIRREMLRRATFTQVLP